MINVSIDDSGMRLKFQNLKDALSDFRPMWPTVQNVMAEFVKQHFATQGGYVQQPWAPLSPRYAAWKQRHHGDKPMMHLTERLYPSLVDPSHGEHVFLSTPSFMEYGTRVPYAWAHQKGYMQRNLPARVVLPVPTKAEGERIVDVIAAFLFRRIRA